MTHILTRPRTQFILLLLLLPSITINGTKGNPLPPWIIFTLKATWTIFSEVFKEDEKVTKIIPLLKWLLESVGNCDPGEWTLTLEYEHRITRCKYISQV